MLGWKRGKILFALINIACLLCCIVTATNIVIENNSTVEYSDKNQYSNKSSKSTHHESSPNHFEQELLAQQAEARRQRKLRDARREGISIVKQTIHSSRTEFCDWLTNPIAALKGEVCGSHYKILRLDRRRPIDKNLVKKSYRKLSLAVHPDKNPSEDAEKAFHLVQSAYECLVDNACQASYSDRLAVEEESILLQRLRLREKLYSSTVRALTRMHYYASVAASHAYQAGSDFWDLVGEWQITLFEEQWPFGKPLVLGVLLWKARLILKLYTLAWAVVKVNRELSKRDAGSNGRGDDSAFT